ncbi:hypothetical protein BDN72DRAFT_866221, partial [Pluteus cervinus]
MTPNDDARIRLNNLLAAKATKELALVGVSKQVSKKKGGQKKKTTLEQELLLLNEQISSIEAELAPGSADGLDDKTKDCKLTFILAIQDDDPPDNAGTRATRSKSKTGNKKGNSASQKKRKRGDSNASEPQAPTDQPDGKDNHSEKRARVEATGLGHEPNGGAVKATQDDGEVKATQEPANEGHAPAGNDDSGVVQAITEGPSPERLSPQAKGFNEATAPKISTTGAKDVVMDGPDSGSEFEWEGDVDDDEYMAKICYQFFYGKRWMKETFGDDGEFEPSSDTYDSSEVEGVDQPRPTYFSVDEVDHSEWEEEALGLEEEVKL